MKRAKLNLLYASGRQALRNAEARYTVQMHEHAPSYFFVGEIRCSPLMSYDCVLCSLSQEETVGHLFLACPFAQACWSLINLTPASADPGLVINSFKDQLNISFFMDIVIILSWSIWMARNDLIFRGIFN
jgi:hypothetical protein